MSTPPQSPPPLPSSTPIPSPHTRAPSSGFFHHVKRAVMGVSPVTDESEFTALRGEFVSLHSALSNLRVHVVAYHKAVQAMHSSSHLVAKDYADLFQDVPRPHPHTHTLLTLCQGHSDLAERAEDPAAYTGPLLTTLDAQLDLHKALLIRIEQRLKLRSDFLYYNKKVDPHTHKRTHT